MKLTQIAFFFILCCLSYSQVSLNLQETPITDDKLGLKELLLTTSVTMGESDNQMSLQAVPDNSVYETYIFEQNICQAADTTSNCWLPTYKNPMYKCQGNCLKKTPESNVISGVQALNSKGSITLQEGKDTLTINNHAIENFKVYFAKSIQSANQVNYFQQGAQLGLGLGMGNENLLSTLKKNRIISKEGFSTWLYQDQMKLYLGAEQKFFADSALNAYNELTTTEKYPLVSSPWTITLDKVMLFNSILIINQMANPPPSVTVSTTSGFLSFPQQHYKVFFDKLKDINLVQCDDYTSNLKLAYNDQKLIQCDCSQINKFPEISFYFSDNSQTSTQQKYTVKPQSYLQKVTGKENYCTVLVKMVPPKKTDVQGENWILGTPFLKSVYAYFNNERRTISMGDLYEFTMEPKLISSSAYTSLIILGAAITFICIVALIIILKRLSVISVIANQTFQPLRSVQPIIQTQQPNLQVLQTIPAYTSGLQYVPQQQNQSIQLVPNQNRLMPMEQQFF